MPESIFEAGGGASRWRPEQWYLQRVRSMSGSYRLARPVATGAHERRLGAVCQALHAIHTLEALVAVPLKPTIIDRTETIRFAHEVNRERRLDGSSQQ